MMEEKPDLELTEKEENSEAAKAAEAQASEAREALEPPEELRLLAAERDRLQEERCFFYEQLLRKQAEFENFRKRMERERQDLHHYASMEVVREMLPVLDGLERALASDPAGNGEFHTGVQLIARQLYDTLVRFGLEPVAARGKKFDPHVHQAVEMVETTEHEDQTVLEEWQRGYLFKNRLLRPAMVKVAVRRESQ